jgi:hypothetical protein
MTEHELLRELGATILDAMREGNWSEHLAAWARVATGEHTPETRVAEAVDGPRLLGEHELWAVRRVQETGAVTSRELAEAAGTCQETARLVLVRMCEDGLLERHGMQRGTWYSGTHRVGLRGAPLAG